MVVFPSEMSVSAGRCEHGVVNRSNAAQFLFDIPSKLPLCGGSERVPLLSEAFHRTLSRITASQTEDGVMQNKMFVDAHNVRNAVTTVHHTARRASRNVQDSV